MKKIKIVIDTSAWISIVRNGCANELAKVIIENDMTLLVCDELMAELFDVFHRNKHYKKNYLYMDVFFDLLNNISIFVSIKRHRTFTGCEDANDNFLFDLAIQTHADIIVSRDDKVLATQTPPPTQVISYNEFRDMYSFDQPPKLLNDKKPTQKSQGFLDWLKKDLAKFFKK